MPMNLWRSTEQPWSAAEEDLASAIRLCEGIAYETARSQTDFESSYGVWRLQNAGQHLRRKFLRLQIVFDKHQPAQDRVTIP